MRIWNGTHTVCAHVIRRIWNGTHTVCGHMIRRIRNGTHTVCGHVIRRIWNGTHTVYAHTIRRIWNGTHMVYGHVIRMCDLPLNIKCRHMLNQYMWFRTKGCGTSVYINMSTQPFLLYDPCFAQL